MDRGHVGLCQDLFGKLQTCFLILTMIGNLHQLLQIVTSTLVGEILMTELHSFQETWLCFIVVLHLQGIHRLYMQHDVLTPVTALRFGIVSNLISDWLCRRVVLVSRLIGGLITPCDVKQTFVALLLTNIFQSFCYFSELILVRCTDKSQHLRVQFCQLRIVLSLNWEADQEDKYQH